MTENPPISKDIKEFYFKLKYRLKLFKQIKINKPTNLLAAACKYGVVFAGTPTGIQCIRTESIFSLDVDPRPTKNLTSYPRRNLNLGVQPSHLSVNADSELLAVALVPSDCAVLFVYSIPSFGSVEVIKKNEVRLNTSPSVTVSDLQWNPAIPNMLAVVMSDGSAAVIEFKDSSFTIFGSIPQNSQASCLCWSPKGKQVVIGAKNGSLTQYKPELKAVKTFPPPQVQGTSGLGVVSVHWLSNFQFIAAYRSSDPSARAHVMVVNVPKNVPNKYVNYEDLCFSSNSSRPEHYFIHQPAWNMLIVGTTNSMEANVLGMDGDSWVQWMLDDGGRAELPLTDNHQDVYNIGMEFDISPTQPVPIGENLTVDPMPVLLMLSHDGVLCFFQAINTIQGAAKICQPPQPFPDSSGLHLFNPPEAGDASSLTGPTKEERKAPNVAKEPAEQLVPAGQPILLTTGSSPSSLGKPVLGQATLAQSSVGQNSPSFNGNISFGQPSSGQAMSFSQPSLTSPSANQSMATPVSKFSLASHSNVGQPSSVQGGLSFGGLVLSQPSNQTLQQPTFSSGASISQSMWGADLGQRTLPQNQVKPSSSPLSSKQSSPIQPSVIAQLPQASFPLSQSNLSSEQPVSINATAQSLPSSQPQPTASISQSQPTAPVSQESASVPLQVQATPNNQSVLNQLQLNQVNQSPQSLSRGSPNPHPVPPASDGQPSSPQQQASKLAPITEVEEEPDEKELLKRIDICQELLRTFSVEMEQKQGAIKYISTQTEHNIGESKVKDQLIQGIEALRKFEEELADTGIPDQTDINALGSNVLEIFGWYEKIKAKERMAKNPGYIELMESQDLDPITKNYLNNIDKYAYYLESQIKQAKTKLSSLWDNIGSPNFEVPVMEVIYQSLVAQMNVLAAKKAVIDSCEAKMKKCNINRVLRNSRRYVGDLELSTLAERLLDTRITESDLLQDTSIRDASNNYIMLSKRIAKKNLNEDKVGALHQWHKNHKVITTKVTKKSTVMVNGDVSKDETFYRIMSPSKQSTPYHATPRKATSSIPRKSLFTLTSNMSNGHLESSKVELSCEKLKQNADLVDQKSDALLSNKNQIIKTKSESNVPKSSVDTSLINNLSVPVCKIVDGNKIDGIQDASNTSAALSIPGLSDSLNCSTSAPSLVTKEAIPTPAYFKSVPSQLTPKEKNENIISTSWGAQTPVFSNSLFSSSNVFATTKVSVSTSDPVFSGSLTSSGQVTNPSVPVSSFTFNLSGTCGNQSSSTKSLFSQPVSTSANSLLFSAKQKAAVAMLAERDSYEPSATTVTAIYTPTPIKLTNSPGTRFNLSSTTMNSFTLPTSVPSPSETNASALSRPVTSSIDLNSSPVTASSSNQISAVKNSPTTASASALSSVVANLPSSTSITPLSLVDKAVPSASSTTLSKLKSSTSIPAPKSSSPITMVNTTSATYPVQQPVSSQTLSILPATTMESSGPETETTKLNAPNWTGESIPSISLGKPATSSPTSVPSLFGGTLLFGPSKSSVATSQPVFGATPEFSLVSSGITTPTFSSISATPGANIFGNASVTTTSTIFGSVNTVSSSSSATTAPPATTLTTSSLTNSAPSLGTTVVSTSVSIFGTSTVTTNIPSLFGPSTTSSSIFTSPTVTSSSPLFDSTTIAASASGFGPAATSIASTSTSAPTSSPGLSSTPGTTASGFSITPASTTSSVFSTTPASTTSSVFSTTPASTTSSVFSTTPAATTSSVVSPTPATITSSVFSTTPTTLSSVFSTAPPTTTSSVFSSTPATVSSSVFSTAPASTTSSVFSTVPAATTSSVSSTTPATTTASGFSSTATTTASGFSSTPATTSTSLFGEVSPTPSSFGKATSIFSNTPKTSASVFGAATTSSSFFGGNSVFGAAITTPSSMFGATNTTTTSVFGAASTTTAPSVFGGVTTTASSIFGTASTTTSSVFGTGSTTTTSSAFGTPGNQGSSIFGAASALSSTSFFGSPTTTSSTSFGNQSAASIFGGSSSFGTPSTTNSFFGKAICSPTSTTASVFGSTSNVFGTTTTTSASSMFGGSSFQQKSPFSQTTGSVFGQTTSSGGNFGTSGGSLFGGTSSFGTPSQGNIFQSGGTGNIFGGTANTGPFSGATSAASQPAFGSPPSFQAAQRPFGTAAPMFGGQSTFGATPTFGGSPTFGSPGKVFGSSAVGSGQTFGSPTQQQSSTFENLANQETLSFGNLAQQQAFPTTSFGGSSFSSWRS